MSTVFLLPCLLTYLLTYIGVFVVCSEHRGRIIALAATPSN